MSNALLSLCLVSESPSLGPFGIDLSGFLHGSPGVALLRKRGGTLYIGLAAPRIGGSCCPPPVCMCRILPAGGICTLLYSCFRKILATAVTFITSSFSVRHIFILYELRLLSLCHLVPLLIVILFFLSLRFLRLRLRPCLLLLPELFL